MAKLCVLEMHACSFACLARSPQVPACVAYAHIVFIFYMYACTLLWHAHDCGARREGYIPIFFLGGRT
jgi:hypothetical protein